MHKTRLWLTSFFLLTASLLYAQEATKNETPAPEMKEEVSVTSHKITVGGQNLSYVAKAGTYVIRNDLGKPTASVFYIAYTLEPVEKSESRPVTFCFNGGPGSCSIWLNLGAFGPKRVVMEGIGYPSLPYRLEDNPFTLLPVTDLVFIDAVATGFSRPAPGEDSKQFFGYDGDVAVMADFIRMYLDRENRWNSPKFLAGESYGTARAAGLAGNLFYKRHIGLNGVLLFSSVLDFAVFNDFLTYTRYLPSYAAVAWHYKMLDESYLSKSLPDFLHEVEHFALYDYTPALLEGDRLPKEKRAEILKKLSGYTGLSTTYLDRAEFGVSVHEFAKELLRNKERTVGRFDGRILGVDANLNGYSFEYDPSFALLLAPFTALSNSYIREELNYHTDLEYRLFGNVGNWKYTDGDNQALEVASSLRKTMLKNPNLNVFVASGYFDLAIPYFATDITFATMGLPPIFQSHVTQKKYYSGHMMYLEKSSEQQFSQDVKEFIDNTVNQPTRVITLDGIGQLP